MERHPFNRDWGKATAADYLAALDKLGLEYTLAEKADPKLRILAHELATLETTRLAYQRSDKNEDGSKGLKAAADEANAKRAAFFDEHWEFVQQGCGMFDNFESNFAAGLESIAGEYPEHIEKMGGVGKITAAVTEESFMRYQRKEDRIPEDMRIIYNMYQAFREHRNLGRNSRGLP